MRARSSYGALTLAGAFALATLGAVSAVAHPLAPALLSLEELASGETVVTWRVSIPT